MSKPLIVGLDDYRLDRERLARLAPRRLTYSLDLKGPDIGRLVPLTPRERVAVVSEHLKRSLSLIERRFRFDSLEPCDRKKPWTSDAVSGVQTFLGLSRSRYVQTLWVKKIAGLRKYRRAARALSFFTVRARVAIQVEGQTSGLQTVEDRFVILKASSLEDAEKRLTGEWQMYAQPYLNPEGELVCWQLEKIMDVYDMMEDTIDPKGTEVYSSFSTRRMKPEYEWHIDRERRESRPSTSRQTGTHRR